MVDVYKPPFATLGDLSDTATDGTAKTAIDAAIDSIIALFVPAQGATAAHPDFDKLPASTANAIKLELDALKAAITAAA